jgi:Uma2 family endonuclease
MQPTAVQKKALAPAPIVSANSAGAKRISWEDFQRRYRSREDGYKYEWVDGAVEKTKRTMDRTQTFILINLLNAFDQLKSQGKATGYLLSEVELFFLENYRRPDIAWFTAEQVDNLRDEAARDVPAFVIEIISSNDQINAVKKKMANYRDAGVQVVWHIFPLLQQVDVYTGKNLSQMTACIGDDLCSADPALPQFILSVNDIFKKAQKPA